MNIATGEFVTVRIPFLRTGRGNEYTEGIVGIVEAVETRRTNPKRVALNRPDTRRAPVCAPKPRISYRVVWEGLNGTTFSRWMRASEIKLAR